MFVAVLVWYAGSRGQSWRRVGQGVTFDVAFIAVVLSSGNHTLDQCSLSLEQSAIFDHQFGKVSCAVLSVYDGLHEGWP